MKSAEKIKAFNETKGAIIGDGVVVHKSTIKGAGQGLFTTRSFDKNEIITEVCGSVISREEANKKDSKSHLKSLSYHSIIDGLNDPRKAEGIGGGSFVNDAKDSHLNNSKFVTDNLQSRCFLRATKPINPGEEIFASYGKSYWKMGFGSS